MFSFVDNCIVYVENTKPPLLTPKKLPEIIHKNRKVLG